MFNNDDIKAILNEMKTTNSLLSKIEKHLSDLTLPPDLVLWARLKKFA